MRGWTILLVRVRIEGGRVTRSLVLPVCDGDRDVSAGAEEPIAQPPALFSTSARQVVEADLNEGALVLSPLIWAR